MLPFGQHKTSNTHHVFCGQFIRVYEKTLQDDNISRTRKTEFIHRIMKDPQGFG